ncbi:MAG: hypothetical protein LBQ61_09910 [Spirochaetales bacterium]|nr:hypothetical protein [Spirochaetales bacterium]
MKKLTETLRGFLNNWPAKILSLTAAIFLYVFYTVNSLESRYFSVPLNVEVAEGYVISANYPASVRITLRGEGAAVFQILEEDIQAYADFSAHDAQGIFRVPVTLRFSGRAAEAGSLEITAAPREITAEIDRLGHKTVEVLPSMTSYPAPGYELDQHLINPATIQVQGPERHLANLSSVFTEDIDLTGRTGDFSQRVSISNTDSFLTFPGGNTVEFLAIIRQSVETRTLTNVGLMFLDLDPRLEVLNRDETGVIQIQGPELLLNELIPGEIFISVDCSAIDRPGSYGVELRPELPPGLTVLSWTPQRLNLQVRSTEGQP